MKAAVIGAGRMGRRHLLAVKAAGLDAAGISDLVTASLLEAQKEGMPEAQCFSDTQAMLESVQPEVVIVSTTAPSHAELVRLAVDMGAKYILCEKPMAISLVQAMDIIEYCAARSVRLSVNHQMRYMEQYTLVKELVRSPELGGLESVTVVGGNMGMAMNGLHFFELFRYLTDAFPVTAQAWFAGENVPNPRGPQFADKGGQIRLENAAGQRLFMDIGIKQGHGLLVTYGCTYGYIIVDELEGLVTVAHRKPEHRRAPSTRYGMPWERYERRIATADLIVPTAAVLKSLIEKESWADGACGLAAMRALVAGYVSDENGHIPIHIDDNLPADREFPWA